MSADSRHCAQNRELISALLDGELSPDERAVLANHLAGCAECRALLDSYRAIGASIRVLPAAQPPADLTNAIYAATVDAEPRRLLFLSSKLGYSLAAVAAVALMFVVAGYLLVGGYQRGVTPTVISSEPTANTIWPTFKPIRITFNKPMDHASVEQSLAIQPVGEDVRLTMHWEGNTLVIGDAQSLRPGGSYVIKITNGARDKWGKRLDSDYTLAFGTSPTVAIEDTPTPQPTAADTPTVGSSATTLPPAPTATQDLGVVPVSPTVAAPTPTASAPASAGAPTATPDAVVPGPNPPTAITGPEDEPTATPTEPPSNAAPTATPAATPTVAPTDTPAPPTPTVPAPTATPAPPPTGTPVAPTPTPATIPVTGAFGDWYWGNDTVQSRLGAPTAAAAPTASQLLAFQYGSMYLRGDTNEIYVLQTDGVWSSFPNTATDDPAAEAGALENTWVPGGALGVLWRNEASVSDALGYAYAATATSFDGQAQTFERGVMLSGPSDVFVIYDDGSWELYPITSADGAATTP